VTKDPAARARAKKATNKWPEQEHVTGHWTEQRFGVLIGETRQWNISPDVLGTQLEIIRLARGVFDEYKYMPMNGSMKETMPTTAMKRLSP
jgi:hypothetical protein